MISSGAAACICSSGIVFKPAPLPFYIVSDCSNIKSKKSIFNIKRRGFCARFRGISAGSAGLLPSAGPGLLWPVFGLFCGLFCRFSFMFYPRYNRAAAYNAIADKPPKICGLYGYSVNLCPADLPGFCRKL